MKIKQSLAKRSYGSAKMSTEFNQETKIKQKTTKQTKKPTTKQTKIHKAVGTSCHKSQLGLWQFEDTNQIKIFVQWCLQLWYWSTYELWLWCTLQRVDVSMSLLLPYQSNLSQFYLYCEFEIDPVFSITIATILIYATKNKDPAKKNI